MPCGLCTRVAEATTIGSRNPGERLRREKLDSNTSSSSRQQNNNYYTTTTIVLAHKRKLKIEKGRRQQHKHTTSYIKRHRGVIAKHTNSISTNTTPDTRC